MRALAPPHWTHQTVEWSRKVASVHWELSRVTHFVLPDLPGVLSREDQRDFFGATTPSTRIVTLVASQHTPATLEQWIQERSQESDTFLVVGGNAKNSTSLTSVEAIQTATRALSYDNHNIWAVANPNDKTSVENVLEKLEAGASGIITQPLLCSHSMEILEQYPRHDDLTYLAGLAMPKTNKGLEFWLNLLEQPELEEDYLVRDHVDYFTSPQRNSLEWSQDQLASLATANIHGIHYMPVNNTVDLLSLLGKT